MAIESGFALAQILQHWPSDDLEAALQFFQNLRKPRTDKITRTSYEAGKIASCAVPEETWGQMFQPEALRDRMKWIMEYDLLGDIRDQMVEEKQPVTKENTQAVKVVA
jgi:salicylate hydroxylase